MIDMANLSKEYLDAIDSIDIEFFMKVTGCENELSAKIALHKLRANCKTIKRYKRRASEKWLRKRNISNIILQPNLH